MVKVYFNCNESGGKLEWIWIFDLYIDSLREWIL